MKYITKEIELDEDFIEQDVETLIFSLSSDLRKYGNTLKIKSQYDESGYFSHFVYSYVESETQSQEEV